MNTPQPVRILLWAFTVLALAAYGSVIVRNVTDTLMGIFSHQQSIVMVQPPNR
jgi:hypothetical protein